MKRSLLVIVAVSVAGLILGGFSLFGHTSTAKAAGPFNIPVASLLNASPSGVTATVNFVDDTGGGGIVDANVTGINIPGLAPFMANFPAVFFFSDSSCLDVIAIAIWDAGAADQNAFLIPGQGLGGIFVDNASTFHFGVDPLGDTTSQTQLYDPQTLSPYTLGASAINSVGISTLPGYLTAPSPYPYLARVQHIACGAVTGTQNGWGAMLNSTWRIPDPACDINEDLNCDNGDATLSLDMNPGTTPCNPIHNTVNHLVGDTYPIAVCATSLGDAADPTDYEPAAFNFDVTFDNTLNQCVIPAGGEPTGPPGTDGNPDANAGTTTFSTPSLGPNYDCTSGGQAPPSCTAGTGSGPGHGRAHISCLNSLSVPTLPIGVAGPYPPSGTTVSAPLGELTFKALGPGTDTIALDAVHLTSKTQISLVRCPAVGGDVNRCFGGTDIKALPPTPTDTATPVPATNTPTSTPVPPTATFTNTPTATNTPTGNSMDKVCPDGSNNCTLWVQKNNCQPTLGKGCLEIDVWIRGIQDVCNPNDIGCTTPEGLGAWDHEMFWDKQFVSVTTAPDNAWLTSHGRVIPPNGCFVQILNEQSLMEGCVTKDTNPPTGAVGPEGSGIVERITITPNLTNLIYAYNMRPTKDNGIATTLADKDCEVTDTQGEMIPGSLPGQLTAHCNSAFITIRMLEGDLDLNCQIDVSDDQAEAFRYGSEIGLALYNKWYDLEPMWSGGDGDIDIKDLQFVFGRNYSTCESPIPNDQGIPVPPVDP
jgi:hypothetical protein